MTRFDEVQNWARSDMRFNAAVELLTRTADLIYPHAPWLIPVSESETIIEPNALLDFTDSYPDSNRAVFSVAASLLGGPTVDLSDISTRLDHRNLVNVLAAISAASGGDYLVTPVRDEKTGQAILELQPNPCPWPSQVSGSHAS